MGYENELNVERVVNGNGSMFAWGRAEAGSREPHGHREVWVKDVSGLHGLGSSDMTIGEECRWRWSSLVNHLT